MKQFIFYRKIILITGLLLTLAAAAVSFSRRTVRRMPASVAS